LRRKINIKKEKDKEKDEEIFKKIKIYIKNKKINPIQVA
jgi:hypothetical protein